MKKKQTGLLPAIARIGHLLLQSKYLSLICVRWWSSAFPKRMSWDVFKKTFWRNNILRCNSRYGSEFKIYTRRYARRKTRRKFDHSPATPKLFQERNNKWEKSIFALCSFRKQREDTDNIHLPTISLRLHFSNSVGWRIRIEKILNWPKNLKFECVLKTHTFWINKVLCRVSILKIRMFNDWWLILE